VFDKRWPVPDGYKPLPGGGMQLIDPTDCPRCGRFRWGKRSHTPCAEHRGGHPEWVCACGQEIYREAGAFVGALSCR
jgi:hypothetical protein